MSHDLFVTPTSVHEGCYRLMHRQLTVIRRLAIQLLIFVFFWATRLSAQQPLQITNNLLELASCRQASTKLSQPYRAQYEKYPLCDALTEVAKNAGLPLWIDRRVDRSRLVSYRSRQDESETTFLTELRGIAKSGGAEFALLETVLYVGPTGQVAAVQRSAVQLHDQLARLRKSKGAPVKSLEWDELTTPTELLAKISQLWKVQVTAKLPHDLMHAGQIEESTLATQLTLLFAGFELQGVCESESAFTTVPLSLESTWQAKYSKAALMDLESEDVSKNFKDSKVVVSGTQVVVLGPTEMHLALFKKNATLTSGNSPVKPRDKTGVGKTSTPKSNDLLQRPFSLPQGFTAPVDRVLEQLAQKFSLTVKWSAAIPEVKRQKPMTLSVPTPKTLDEVLQMVSAESGFKIQRSGQVIEVEPK